MTNKKRIEQIVFLCDYGMVRSKTMCQAAVHGDHKYDFTFRDALYVAGVLNHTVEQQRYNLSKVDKVVICNKPSFDTKFKDKNYPEDQKEALWKLFMEEFKDKVIICDALGEDVWQQAGHPDLYKICVEWIDKNGDKILEGT